MGRIVAEYEYTSLYPSPEWLVEIKVHNFSSDRETNQWVIDSIRKIVDEANRKTGGK